MREVTAVKQISVQLFDFRIGKTCFFQQFNGLGRLKGEDGAQSCSVATELESFGYVSK
jgi:hypothetical protein